MNKFSRQLDSLSPEKREILKQRLAQRGIKVPNKEVIPRRKETDACPLSFAQQRLWFLDQLESGNIAYLNPRALSIQGILEVAVLERSFAELIWRHESLRTTFTLQGDKPVQIIHPADEEYYFPLIDMCALNAEGRRDEVQRLAEQEAQHPCNLEHGLLMRTYLLRLDTQEHVFLLTMHHIISDGWSMEIFVREISALYNAYIQGMPSPLTELPIQYADFALWQRTWLQGEALERQLRYWTEQLHDLAPLNLPTDYSRPAVQSYRGTYQRLLLPTQLHADLKALSQCEGVTLFMTLLAAFQILLAGYSGQDDVAVGTPIANRTRAELEAVIGFFVNTLVMRTDLSGNPTFVDILKRVREVCLGAYAHQDIPFDKLVEKLEPRHDLSRTPLFQVMFVLQNVPRERTELTALSLRPLAVRSTISKFDLTLWLTQTEQELGCSLEYSTDLFEADTITRLLSHWQTLLEEIVHNPQAHVSDLRLLTDSERERLLVEWNTTQCSYPQDLCVQHLFERQVRHTPDAVAVAFEEQVITYAELNRRANQLAHYLHNLGAGPEVVVGLCIERSIEMVVGLLGILKAGGAYLPLDPAYPPERLAFMLEDSQVLMLITRHHLLTSLSSEQTTLVLMDSDAPLLAQQWSTDPAFPASSLDLVYVIYTSGSTGRPKGVPITHVSLLNLIFWHQRAFNVTNCDRATQLTSPAFDATGWEIWPYLTIGACVSLANEEIRVTPLRLRDWLVRHAITITFLPTPLAESSMDLPWPATTALRCLLTGADTLHRYPPATWPFTLINNYGPTEATVVATYGLISPGEQATRPVSIGRPIANTQIYILDSHLQPVPIGIFGELYIGGVGLTQGYFKHAELTAEKFLPHPFSEQAGDRLYRTGDLARYRVNGDIEFAGRRDHQTKLRGYRIELGEIEAVLRQHPAVQECVVLVREDVPGEKRLVAYLVLQQGDSLTKSDLHTYLQERLPTYMYPSAFVTLEVLPLTANGKIDRGGLPAPAEDQDEDSSMQEETRTPLEDLLLEHWKAVLGRRHIGIHENFFELGGHSLLAAQVIARARQMIKRDIPLRTLFEAPTISDLAQQMGQILRDDETERLLPLLPVSRDQALPLSFAQQRLWFLDQLEPETTVYSIRTAVQFDGKLDYRALAQSFSTMLVRHESLRTVFPVVEQEPVQVIGSAEMRLPLVDLSGLVHQYTDPEVQHLIWSDVHHPFDLTHGPLLRVTLLRLQAQVHILLLTMHHIISDGWSMEVFVREIGALYNAYTQDLPSPLAPLPIQYADFAHWQRTWLQGEVLEKQLRYWSKQLRDLVPLNLPTDRSRPAIQSHRGGHQRLLLPAQLHADLKALSQREEVTLFMTLLAAVQVLLARYSGQYDIAVGTPIASRTQAETENLIGFFVNTLVLRTDLSGNPPFQEVLRRVREVALGAYAHQDLPFEKLVEALQPERDMSRSPLFQVMFVLQNRAVPHEALGDLVLHNINYESTTTKFDLTLTAIETQQGLLCNVEYTTDLFEEKTTHRLLNHLHTLLVGIVAHPDQRLAHLPLLNESEYHQLLITSQEPFPDEGCLHTLFEAQVERTPDAVALVMQDEQLTYNELNLRANRFAHYLIALNADHGTGLPVPVCLERTFSLVVSLLGILKSGGAYVPLDPTYPQERLSFMVENMQASVLVTQKEYLLRFPDFPRPIICIDDHWNKIRLQSGQNLSNQTSGFDLAYIIYTSGSTGIPKAAGVYHHSFVNLLQWFITSFKLSPQDRNLLITSFSFDLTQKNLFAPFLVGGSVHLFESQYYDNYGITQTIAHQQITLLNCTPSAFYPLLDASEEDVWSLLSSLRTVFLGGEPIVLSRMQSWLTSSQCHANVVNTYGPTECSDVVSFHCLNLDKELETSLVPIGKPIANTTLCIMDNYLQLLPIGLIGDLYIAGECIGAGYINDSPLTATRFIPHPYSAVPGTRMYKTGDLARYREDGCIEFVGRADYQVKIRGYRIEPGEIEAVLGQYPAISESLVTTWEDEKNDVRLVAYVVLNESKKLQREQLRQYMQAKLADYMVPSWFVELDRWPLTPSGKVDRQALPAPLPTGSGIDGQSTQARSPIVETITEIWRDVLNLSRVEVDDNFFTLGGHSLLATQLIARLRQVLRVEVPLRSVFAFPTIDQLATHVEHLIRYMQGIIIPPLTRLERPPFIPLSFAQQRLWFLDQLVPGNPAYNICTGVLLEGELHLIAFQQSFSTLQQRHESLRTIFAMQGETPVQVMPTQHSDLLTLVNLCDLPDDLGEVLARDMVQQEMSSPFNLSQGPLLRIRLLRLKPKTHLLLLTMHHIISDGWSMSIFVREFSTLYNAYAQGQPSPLAELPIQYADYAIWQRTWLQGQVLEKQLRYWMRHLRGITPLLLPTDRPRPAVPTQQGARYTFAIAKDLSQALIALSRQEGVTLFSVLLAALQTLFYRYTGQTDIVVGTDIANRITVETEALIGFFVNLLVLRADLSGSPTFQELLHRVHEVVLEAYTYGDTPFEMLVERLQIRFSPNSPPLVQALLVMQNTPSDQKVELTSLTIHSLAVEPRSAKFDIALFVQEMSGGLQVSVVYNTDLFDANTIVTMMERFGVLLHNIVEQTDISIDLLDFRTDAEKIRQTRHSGFIRHRLQLTRKKETNRD